MFISEYLVTGARWRPPAGIPLPEFGITTPTIPTTPTLIVNGDLAEEIPNTLAAGSYVRVIGNYAKSHASPNTIRANGTAQDPVIIEGGNWTSRVDGTPHEFTGTYLLIKDAIIYNAAITDRTDAGASNHICFRDCQFVGNSSGGGVLTANWHGGPLSQVVFLRCIFRDIGNINASGDPDDHGLAISEESSYVFVLDSTFLRCSGDGVQINGGSGVNWADTHHLYVGRNFFATNRQSGAWAKQCAYPVFSENIAFDMRPRGTSPTSPGIGFGGQYGPEFFVLINNVAISCEHGIQLASYDAGFGDGVVCVGNHLYLITTTGSDVDSDPNTPGAAFLLRATGTKWIWNNLIRNCDGCIQVPAAASTGAVDLRNNIVVSNRRSEFVTDGSPALAVSHMLFDETPVAIPSELSDDLIATNAIIANPQLDASGRLPNGSPGKNNALNMNGLNDLYYAAHGVPLGVDLSGDRGGRAFWP